MSSPSSVLTRGLGTWGSPSLLLTRGLGNYLTSQSAPITGPWTNVTTFAITPQLELEATHQKPLLKLTTGRTDLEAKCPPQ